jgi:hypothetical protein
MAFQPANPNGPDDHLPDDPLQRAAKLAGHPVADDEFLLPPGMDEIGLRREFATDKEKHAMLFGLVRQTLEEAGVDTSEITPDYQVSTAEANDYKIEEMTRNSDPEDDKLPASRPSREWALNHAVQRVISLTMFAGFNRTAVVDKELTPEEAELVILSEFLTLAEDIEIEHTIKPDEKRALVQAAMRHAGIPQG